MVAYHDVRNFIILLYYNHSQGQGSGLVWFFKDVMCHWTVSMGQDVGLQF